MFNVDWMSSFRSAVSTQRFVDAFKKRARKTIPRARRTHAGNHSLIVRLHFGAQHRTALKPTLPPERPPTVNLDSVSQWIRESLFPLAVVTLLLDLIFR